MTRKRRRWKIVALLSGAVLALLVAAAVIANWWEHATERTYYGPHSDLLHVGERVILAREVEAVGHHVVPKDESGTVQEEPAWDEDSCDPDRPIKIVLISGASISVPRNILHR